ncbi:MAG: hypothetical protein OXE94_03875 [Aestuariivita sp.]|nr:hypothetical protein [Aestuariivita sp.]MCY4202540.1 hypothetical protein [Aestuariivita sp.]MCY4287426.1 hypothetical protein [Aestuariivita sp.]MCY4347260.1 hypothetical protein [Aestuariivita sp.]
MRNLLVSILLMAFGSSASFANCFASMPLGYYNLGGWSGPGPMNDDPRWEVSGMVGSDDRYSTIEDMAAARDGFIEQCSTLGNSIISEAEGHLLARKNASAQRFEAWCPSGPFCSAVRQMTIDYEQTRLDKEITRMKQWYTNNIASCEWDFRGTYNEFSPYLCE